MNLKHFNLIPLCFCWEIYICLHIVPEINGTKQCLDNDQHKEVLRTVAEALNFAMVTIINPTYFNYIKFFPLSEKPQNSFILNLILNLKYILK